VEKRFASWMSEEDRAGISAGIIDALDAPLGEPFAGNTLRTLGSRHRLSELEFNFRLPQDSSSGLHRIGELMLEHGSLDPRLAAYAEAIAKNEGAPEVAGFMTGFIDAVFRVQPDGGTPVYVVADYKTNLLHHPGDDSENPLVAYHPDNLVEPMIKHGYVLQALVYSVALHRYLRWRQPGYDPDLHLGGSAYLFMRGMTGTLTPETTPRPLGVYFWRPTTPLVLGVDALFAGKDA
jgi:exodeoxyribonuclease V beta subunit